MRFSSTFQLQRVQHTVAAMLLAAFAAVGAHAQSAALQQRRSELQENLAHSPFGRPVHLESSETAEGLRGEIYAIVDRSFDSVESALKSPQGWCELLMLHLNTKACVVESTGDATVLQVSVGRKHDQPLSDAQRVDFSYRIAAGDASFLDVRLQADQGPLSTHDYRIVLEAIPSGAKQTFVHLRYSYSYGSAARLAMRGYLATLGRDKIGFTTLAAENAGAPQYVQGIRGVVERNTMRYYLAIDAYLASLTAPVAEQRSRRLAAWFDATEQYARQLHEMDRDAYLSMKQLELARLPPIS